MTRDKAKTEAVPVPRAVLLSLLAALAVATLLVAYLMGRDSVRKSVQALPAPMPAETQTAPAATAATEAAPALAAPSPIPSSIEVVPPASVSDPAPQTPAAAPLAPPAQPAQGASAATDKLRDDVARYFRDVETIQSQAKSSGDPETLARTLLEQGVKGDARGFDGLVASNRKVLEALRTVQVPEPCREHHRLTLGLLEQSIAMLDHVKGQLQGGNEASLAALPAQGQELERGAKEADALAADIKRRFGL